MLLTMGMTLVNRCFNIRFSKIKIINEIAYLTNDFNVKISKCSGNALCGLYGN